MTPAEVRALLEAATPGPWYWDPRTGTVEHDGAPAPSVLREDPESDPDGGWTVAEAVEIADDGLLLAAAPDLASAYLAAEDRLAALEAERDALAAHVARLREALHGVCGGDDARPDTVAALWQEADAALAATPAVSLEAHDDHVRAAALREAAALVRDLEPTWDLSEAGAYERAAKALRAGADAVERGCAP